MAKRKQKISTAPVATYPAVSVIIPLYNAEKYIGECLDSLLAQTFTNFEVIVVDDCSTDSSREVVQSYAEKFGGRLTLSHTQENSGGGGYVPRNIGLGLSRGEYVFFVDADDFVAKNALEVLHSAAKEFNADVVYSGACHIVKSSDNVEIKIDKEGERLIQNGLEDKPTLTINDPEKNLQKLLVIGNRREPWSKLVQRKFLIENEIRFPDIVSGGDFIWLIHVYCCSKRFLRIPIPIYFYRHSSSESITRKKRSTSEQIVYWVSAFTPWTKALDELSNHTKILKENPVYCYIALRLHFNFSMTRFFEERMKLQPQTIYEILCREFAKDDSPIMPFLFSVIDSQQKNLIQAQQQFIKFQQFAAQAQARIAQLEAELKRRQI